MRQKDLGSIALRPSSCRLIIAGSRSLLVHTYYSERRALTFSKYSSGLGHTVVISFSTTHGGNPLRVDPPQSRLQQILIGSLSTYAPSLAIGRCGTYHQTFIASPSSIASCGRQRFDLNADPTLLASESFRKMRESNWLKPIVIANRVAADA